MEGNILCGCGMCGTNRAWVRWRGGGGHFNLELTRWLMLLLLLPLLLLWHLAPALCRIPLSAVSART